MLIYKMTFLIIKLKIHCKNYADAALNEITPAEYIKLYIIII